MSFRFFRKSTELSPQATMIVRLAAILVLMALSRSMLYFLNIGLFSQISVSKYFFYLFAGLRFDLVALIYLNLVYIFMMILPFRARRNRLYNKLADIIFIFTNSILLIPNLADTVYYRFTLKRMTGDIFTYITTGSDTAEMMPQFIHDFWFVPAFLLAAVMIIIWITAKIKVSVRYVSRSSPSYFISQSLLFVLFAGLALLGARGGFQLKPVGPLSASQYAPAEETPVVLNSAFTIIRTLGQQGLQRVSYFKTENDAHSYFNPVKQYALTDSTGNTIPMRKKNIFIIILESFSSEHIGALNGHQGNPLFDYTPFLDSLIGRSVVFDGYANSKRSIEGIPAVLASMPTYMNEDFITSRFGSQPFNSIANLLKPKGYYTFFFHGGKNGTMGFDNFCKSAGFDDYFGLNEYPDQQDFDGHWGIWDAPYLQYVSRKISTFRQPFAGAVFTLSSHHPYKVPDQFAGKFRKGPLEIQQTISYTDYALQQFFKSIQAQPWYSNTIFVITADHTSEAWLPFYRQRIGQYSIPIIFFQPGNSPALKKSITAQQTDILPTLLDMIHYPDPFVAFGNSLVNAMEPRFSLSMVNSSFQLIQDGYAYQSGNSAEPALYCFRNDSLLKHNLARSKPEVAKKMDLLLKAVYQQYSSRLIDNKLKMR